MPKSGASDGRSLFGRVFGHAQSPAVPAYNELFDRAVGIQIGRLECAQNFKRRVRAANRHGRGRRAAVRFFGRRDRTVRQAQNRARHAPRSVYSNVRRSVANNAVQLRGRYKTLARAHYKSVLCAHCRVCGVRRRKISG